MQRKFKQHQYQQNELCIANHLKDKETKAMTYIQRTEIHSNR
jgi:hypothetical protein